MIYLYHYVIFYVVISINHHDLFIDDGDFHKPLYDLLIDDGDFHILLMAV